MSLAVIRESAMSVKHRFTHRATKPQHCSLVKVFEYSSSVYDRVMYAESSEIKCNECCNHSVANNFAGDVGSALEVSIFFMI